MVAEAWSWEEEKAFENAVAIYCETCSDWLEKIASAVPGKTLEEVKAHHEILVEDVASIEAGRVPLPNYASSSAAAAAANAEDSTDVGEHGKKGGASHGDSAKKGKGSLFDLERRKGIAWTEEEHRLFLLGLEKYGKGDWRSISRNFVISRTPTQVASHAQKYFIRQNSMNKDRRRSSIHDITRVNDGDAASPQGPITGQGNSAAVSAGNANRQSSHTPSAPGINIYGATIGQPVGVPTLMPTIGTPVAGPHVAYGLRPPMVPGVVVSGAPVSFSPMAYQIPNASSQR
ncbi:hypothetical protein KFK09_020232 [Dendrobium nobile]|uniref:Transcription factor MYBS1 n=1 Tax=Dendrobium nobile TaxID=94219 RepID=A0A8T3ASR0_DENNO|nr:hypothetical protein KFK09_020232 [Dendrobium nobile]